MHCENLFCIYQLKGKCLLDEISINAIGLCTDCIYPNIDEKILDREKAKLYKKYNEADNVGTLIRSVTDYATTVKSEFHVKE